MGDWLANDKDDFGSKVPVISVQDSVFENQRAL
jgi:hypothetical protein